MTPRSAAFRRSPPPVHPCAAPRGGASDRPGPRGPRLARTRPNAVADPRRWTARADAAAPTTPARAPRVARARSALRAIARCSSRLSGCRCRRHSRPRCRQPHCHGGARSAPRLSARGVRARAGSRAHLGSNSRTATKPTDLSLSGCASAQETVRRSPPSLGVSPSATAVRAPSGDPPEGLLPACPGTVATPAAGADMAARRRLKTRCPHACASNARWSRARAALPNHTYQEGGCGLATRHAGLETPLGTHGYFPPG
jgi:hypothetical protein